MHCCNNNCQQCSYKKQPKEYNCWCCCKEKVNECSKSNCNCNSWQKNFEQPSCFEKNFQNDCSEY